MPGFAIGGDVHGRVAVNITNGYMDGDLRWLVADVAIRVGGFKGDFSTSFLVRDVSRFLQELRQLFTTLEGRAQFTTWEKQIELILEGNGRGQVAITGEAMDEAGTGSKLSFEIGTDQTYLPQLINELESICATYPECAT
jgi:hypothetical protein